MTNSPTDSAVPPEAYEAARNAVDDWVATLTDIDDLWDHRDRGKTCADAVWPLGFAAGVAEGRRRAAAEIRAEYLTGSKWFSPPGMKSILHPPELVAEWAARIAEGNTDA